MPNNLKNNQEVKCSRITDWNVWVVVLFAIIAFIFTLPMFINIDNWGGQDWDLHTFFQAVPRRTIVEYHQFPLWNPYHCGGSPLLAYPQSYLLSPIFSVLVLFGEIRGMKIEIWLFMILGMYGTFLVARHYRLEKIPSIFASFIFMLSSTYTVSAIAGNITLFNTAYIPWVFLFFLKSFTDIKYVAFCSFAILLIYFGGGVHTLLMVFAFIGVYAILAILCRENKLLPTAKIAFLIGIMVILLGAVKFFPSIELTLRYPRYITDYSGFSLKSLGYCLFSRDQAYASLYKFPRDLGLIDGMSWGMDENSMYIGFIPALLFLIGICFYFKRRMELALTTIVIFWLIFGNRVPVSLWEFLHKLPIYNLQRVATRYRFIFIFCLSLFAAFGLQRLKDWIAGRTNNKRLANIISKIILLIVLVDLMVIGIPLWKNAFVIPPLTIIQSNEFYQVWRGPGYDKSGITIMEYEADEGSSYVNYLSHLGTVDAYEPVPFPRNALPKGSDDYRGEVYIAGSDGIAAIKEWTPNRLVIGVDVLSEDYLIVNQNYYPGWKIKGKRDTGVESRDGLISVKVFPDDKEIELYYLPDTFIMGLITTSLTVLLLIYLFARSRLPRFIRNSEEGA